jgi:hypothetical protein
MLTGTLANGQPISVPIWVQLKGIHHVQRSSVRQAIIGQGMPST